MQLKGNLLNTTNKMDTPKKQLTPELAVEELKEELGLEMYTILTKAENLKAKLLEVLSTYQGLEDHEVVALDWIYSLYFPKTITTPLV